MYCCFRDCTLVARLSSQSVKTTITLNLTESIIWTFHIFCSDTLKSRKCLKVCQNLDFRVIKKSGSMLIWSWYNFWWIFDERIKIKKFCRIFAKFLFQSLSYDVIGRQVEACFINITVDLHYNERIRTSELFNFKGPAKIPPSPALWRHNLLLNDDIISNESYLMSH